MNLVARRVFLSCFLLILVFGSAANLTKAGSGRPHALCVQSCNDARAACQAGCVGDCSLYPIDSVEFELCLDLCDAVCLQNSQDCKPLCQDTTIPLVPLEVALLTFRV